MCVYGLFLCMYDVHVCVCSTYGSSYFIYVFWALCVIAARVRMCGAFQAEFLAQIVPFASS
jgi:hypothetical protein